MQKKDNAWNPYIAGALSGIVLIFSVLLTGNYFGTSTSFVMVLGMLEKVLSPERFVQLAYFKTIPTTLHWQILFVLGILVGGFIAAKMFGDFSIQAIPERWKTRFGSSKPKRYAVAFIGGIISMFGARLAGGCPSGQLSASALLSVSGFTAMILFFIFGIATATLVYRGGNKR
ncbi:YeeE/YedE family protein [Alkalibacter rhizosphaerae]|uniref:YeeE/YedE family protein n=1 Tax=Alkalibacter rhizosphaerae TaxID=2815577 RepID=A0A975AI83_9FIRM|nr:YeeE/YedE thiosulfate transporter family protein [Alkalibacter rhizosphaerae]QSX09409.1 YeeE/YedE family protein [Alkalibacter rhizosphaerae]